MPHVKTVKEIFAAASPSIDQLYFNIDMLEALSNKIIVMGDDAGKIEDFIVAGGDGSTAKWWSIVSGMKDILLKMQIKGLGIYITADSSPGQENADLVDTFDFQAGYYSAYRTPAQLSLGTINLHQFLDSDGSTFPELDANTQVDIVHALRDALDDLVGTFETLGCFKNAR